MNPLQAPGATDTDDASAAAGAPPWMSPWWWSASVLADVVLDSGADAAALASRQRSRLEALLRFAQRASPRYRRLLAAVDPAQVRLGDLPVAHKAELMADFDAWVTDPRVTLAAVRRFLHDPARVAELFLGAYTVWESSGTSGTPGVFVQDAGAMAVYDALESQRRAPVRPTARWLDPWGLSERLAFVGAVGHFAGAVTIARLQRLWPAAAGRLTTLSFLQPPADLARQLEAFRPTILATYPSAAAWLAREQRSGRIRIEPREIWTGGEDLSAGVARWVSQSFDCPVVDSYGCSECLALASSCVHGALHLNADWVIVEPVDARGRPVPAGEFGATTLVTNLANRVQPIIRYDVGDRVAIDPRPCACGSCLPVIRVQGRRDDTLRLRAAAGRSVDLLPLALMTVLEDDAQLYDVQLEQTGPAELVLRGELDRAALERGCRALARYLAAQGLTRVALRAEHAPCRRSPSGKLRRVLARAPRGR